MAGETKKKSLIELHRGDDITPEVPTDFLQSDAFLRHIFARVEVGIAASIRVENAHNLLEQRLQKTEGVLLNVEARLGEVRDAIKDGAQIIRLTREELIRLEGRTGAIEMDQETTGQRQQMTAKQATDALRLEIARESLAETKEQNRYWGRWFADVGVKYIVIALAAAGLALLVNYAMHK